ncbi:MAG: ergothioneine biosynthesis protein EgtB [Burkholderiaceae bacterium]|nr:MAG: ergothioneine biosynthesis protein EgtB [Burkholderiaceae bacterium]
MTISGSLLTRYEAVRSATLKLADPLSEEDCCVQSMPDASPVKWHLAHTTWFFETFILEKFEADFKPFQAAFRILFNSYYNGVGEKYPRPNRGLLTRPSLAEIKAYRHHVDARMHTLLLAATTPGHALSADLAAMVVLGLHHEQQHQELILSDILHLFWHNPLYPAYTPQPYEPVPDVIAPLQWVAIQGGVVRIGHATDEFCFDNELPRHRRYIEPFELASRLVTNDEYCAFMDAGAYQSPSLWLSAGWDWLHAAAQPITHPLYWQQTGEKWNEFTLNGLTPLDGRRAVRHLSFFEADAYARWAKARLPTEAEWEYAVTAQAGANTPQPDSPTLAQLFDTGWQWTSSSYAPYPGFQPARGAVGEYNGKFMVNQYVLRGASCATPTGHSRATYRNFFPAQSRWQFTALRLARST